MLLGCLGAMVGLALLCCCGGVVGTTLFPAALVSFFLDDAPLPGPTTAPDPAAVAVSRARICAELATTGETHLSPDEVARWLLEDNSPQITVLRLGAQGDTASLALSVATESAPPKWLNLQIRGAFAMEYGWFTDLRIDQVVVAGHDGSAMLAHQQLAQQANQSMANQRAQDPDMAALLTSIPEIKVENGALTLKVVQGGAAMQRLCAAP